jgi:3-oxoadipate enol-lactonase
VSSPVDLSWDAEGDPEAPAIVFAHALGSDRSIWEHQAGALKASHRVVRIDLRAHGASPAPPGPYSIEDIAMDVLRVADGAGIRRFRYCGVSLGGLVGLWLAAHHPDRISALVAANTASKIGTAEGWRERAIAVAGKGLAPLADGIPARWVSPDFAAKDPERLERLRRAFVSTNPEGYLACCHALGHADVTPMLSSIRAPTLVVGGRLDVSTPVSDAESLHSRIEGSLLVVLENAAHLSNLDQAELFTAAVAQFLARSPE